MWHCALRFFRNAKFRTARSRIVFDLFVRGRHWFSIYLFHRCTALHLIDLFVRRVDQVPALLPEEILDDAVLQRVEGDDGEPASGFEG